LRVACVFPHSEGDFMTATTVCANDVAYGLFELYVTFTESVYIA